MRWMSWPIFVSCEDDDEKTLFWTQVLIPALEDIFPQMRRNGRSAEVPPEDYPWPSEAVVKVKRADFPEFVRCLQYHASQSLNWLQTLTMTIKLGQKSSPLQAEDFFDGTLGNSMQNFDLEGIHCMFWSTGFVFEYPADCEKAKAGFWRTDFLNKELRSMFRKGRKKNVYYLLGTTELAAVQAEGHPPECMLFTWESIKKLATDCAVEFDLETSQFYSTFIYQFKTSSTACNPRDPEWWHSSPALLWLFKLLGTRSVDDDQAGPLSKFITLVNSLPAIADSPLRFEPTFYLKFNRNHRNDDRLHCLKTLYNSSALLIGNCFLDLLSEGNVCHTTCNLETALDRLSALATVYDHVAQRIKQFAKVSALVDVKKVLRCIFDRFEGFFPCTRESC